MRKRLISILKWGRQDWVAKPYRRIPFANEQIAFYLSEILKLRGVSVPYPALTDYQGRQYQLSKYNPQATTLKFQDNAPTLPPYGINGLLLKLILADIDGNWQNILVDNVLV